MYIVEAVVNSNVSFSMEGFKSAEIYHTDCDDLFSVIHVISDIVKKFDDVVEINVFLNKE